MRYILFFLLLLLPLSPAHAASLTFTVNSAALDFDANPGDGICATSNNECTLVAAIDEANRYPGEDTVKLPAGFYSLEFPGGNPYYYLSIKDHLRVTGVLSSTTIIDAEDQHRVFYIDSTIHVTMEHLTVQGGNTHNDITRNGGAFYNAGFLSLNSVQVRNNRAQYFGGGIANSGILTVTDSLIEGNDAYFGGGIGNSNNNRMTLIRTVIRNNQVDIEGGGIAMTGYGTIIDSAIISNTALLGGGIFAGEAQLAISGSTISGNTARMGGGMNIVADLSLLEAQHSIRDNSAHRLPAYLAHVASVPYIARTELIASRVLNNRSEHSGGGIASTDTLTVSDSLIAGNISILYGGGGISHASPTHPLTLIRTTVRSNQARLGGGIEVGGHASIRASTIISNTAQAGGGINLFENSSLILDQSTVSGNIAQSSSLSGYGGGVSSAGSLHIVNSTLSSNRAQHGGALAQGEANGARSSIFQSTITGNSAPDAAGIAVISGTAILTRTLLAGNNGNDCAGVLRSGDYNLIGVTNGCTLQGLTAHNLTGRAPLLGPLANNGGPTLTHALLAGSPALNTGGPCQGVDQRGITRPQGPACDIGAYEANQPANPAVIPRAYMSLVLRR